MISSPQARYLYQHVVLENWNKFNLHFFHDFYFYHADNVVLWLFFQIQIKLRTRKLNEGGYGALNPDMNTSMLKSKICLIINYSINFELFHVYNNVKWSFFQIQNNCRPKKLKKVKYAALNQNTKTSMLCLKIEIILIIISNKTFYLYHADNDVLWSFFQLQKKMDN